MLLGRLRRMQLERLYRDDEPLEDRLVSRDVFKGLQKLGELMVNGYEHTFQMWGLGGMGSVFGLLELAVTCYKELPLVPLQQVGSAIENMTQTLGERESTRSAAGKSSEKVRS